MRRNEDRAKEKEPTYEERRREDAQNTGALYQNEKGGVKTGQPGSKNKRPSRKSQRTKSKSKRTTQKRPSTTEQDKLFFSPSPTPLEKYKPTFSPNVSTFRDFLPCFISNLPTPTLTPIQSYAQDTRLRVYTRSRSQRICHFCLHPSPHPATNCRSIG